MIDAMNKTLMICILLIANINVLPAQDTLYFDPSNSDDPSQDGTIAHPYENLESVTYQDNTVYLLKRGSIMEFGSTSFNNIENIVLDAYGSGDRPRIIGGQINIYGCNGFTVKNLDIFTTRICLNFDHKYDNRNIEINNCKLHSGNWNKYNYGIYGIVKGIQIIDCEIFNIYRDGIYLNSSKDIDIRNCYVHDVNKLFTVAPAVSGGDGAQFIGCENIYIGNSVFDRSDSGRKFCVIFTKNPKDVVIEDCHFIGPRKTQYGGACLHAGGTGFVIRRNIFEQAPTGIYNHSSDMIIHNNQFIDLNKAIQFASDGQNRKIYNNIFYDNELGIESWLRQVDIKNNIVYLTSEDQKAYHIAGADFSNNMQNIEGVAAHDDAIIQDPLFVDPENYDFHLKENSPAVDAGIDVGIEEDFDGNTINPNHVDLGAFEYTGGNYNERPVVQYDQDSIYCAPGSKVWMNSNTSYDPDGDPLDYYWSVPYLIEIDSPHQKYPVISIPEGTEDTTIAITLTAKDNQYMSLDNEIYFDINKSYLKKDTKTGSEYFTRSKSNLDLEYSANGHFFVDNQGNPVFISGDTGWGITYNCSRAEMEKYLNKRAEQNFNTILFCAFGDPTNKAWGSETNYYGDLPFQKVDGDFDPTQPITTLGNDTSDAGQYDFWDNVDYFLQLATSKGFYIIFAPTWGSWIAGDYHMQDRSSVIFNENNAYEYGFFLGERYTEYTNIFWSLGGDRDASAPGYDYKPVFRALAEGIADGTNDSYGQDGSADYTDTYMSFHGRKNRRNSSEYFHGEDWLGYNQIQEDIDGQYVDILDDYSLSPVLPTFMLEGYYEERDNRFSPWQIRIQAYQTVFSGAFGHVYGQNNVYGFSSTSSDWYQKLSDPGATDMKHLYTLMTQTLSDKQLLTRKPAQYLIDGDTGGTNGSGTSATSDRITATTGADSAFALVYSANGRNIDLLMDKLHGSTMSAYWFNPRNGSWYVAGTEYDQPQPFDESVPSGAAASSASFNPPGSTGDENDWVLVLLLNQSGVQACFTVDHDSETAYKVNLDAACSKPSEDQQLTSYKWNFGDGNTGTGDALSYTYASPGDYTIQLIVTDDAQVSDTSSQQITIEQVTEPKPTACFTKEMDAEDNFTVNLDAACSEPYQGQTITSYAWTFGDGNDASGASGSHTYEDPGTYDIQLIVTNDAGYADTTTQQVTIEQTTEPKPTACFTKEMDTEDNFTVNFDAACSVPYQGQTITSYAWTFGDGNDASGASGSHTYEDPGTYDIQLIVTNDAGYADTTTQQVTIEQTTEPKPTACFTKEIDAENPLSVNLDASCSDPYQGQTITDYSWKFGDYHGASGVSGSHTYENPGTYNIRLIVTNDADYSDTTIQQITLEETTGSAKPEACFSWENDADRIYSIHFDASCSNASREKSIDHYAWNFGDGNEASGVSGSHTYDNPGAYDIQLIVTNDAQYADTVIQQVTIDKIAVEACFNYTIDSLNTFEVHFEAGCSSSDKGTINQYVWNFGDSSQDTGSSVTHTYTTEGIFSVQLKTLTHHTSVSDSITKKVEIQSISSYSDQHLGHKDMFNIFPNPATEIIQVHMNEPLNGKLHVKILSLSGKVIEHRNKFLAGDQFSLNVSQYPPGIYLLQIRTVNVTAFEKIIIK